MKFAKKLFDFYINSSIHVALAVYSFVLITKLYFGLPYNEPVDYFIFYGTITGYNFVKYAGLAKLHHRSLTNNLKIIQVFSFFCFLLTLFYGYQLSVKTALLFIPFGLLTILYSIPLGKLVKNLRSVPSLKIIIISVVWAGSTVLVPFFDVHDSMNENVILACIQRFLFVFVLTLPFDIRDVQFDTKELKTFPQIIGVKPTKKLGFIVLGLTLLIEFFIAPTSDFKSVFLVVFCVLLVFLQRASIHQKKYYASFWVEAIPVFWLFLLLLFNKFAI